MSRQIQIEWVQLGKSVTATLLEDKNQNLCDLLWDNLPYCSIQTHALVSGEQLMKAGVPVVLAGDYNVVPATQDIYPTRSLDKNTLIQPQSRQAHARLLSQGCH